MIAWIYLIVGIVGAGWAHREIVKRGEKSPWGALALLILFWPVGVILVLIERHKEN